VHIGDGQLGPLVRRPRLSAEDVGSEVWILIEQAGRPQPEQRVHHHEVAGAERPIEPLGTPQPIGKLAEPGADAIPDQSHALRRPAPVVFLKLRSLQIEDRRLDGGERGKHPHDRSRPGIGILR